MTEETAAEQAKLDATLDDSVAADEASSGGTEELPVEDEAQLERAWEAARDAAESARRDESAPAEGDPPSGHLSGSGGGFPLLIAEGDGGEVVHPDPKQLQAVDDVDVYRAMSAADERQIAQELEGKAVTAMLYSFKQGKQRVTGLSWVGAREAVRQVNTRGFGKIRISPEHKPEFEEVMVRAEIGADPETGELIFGEVPGWSCTVFGQDELHGGGMWATAMQTRDQVVKDKSQRSPEGLYHWRPDPFSRTKALSKAQRNALEGFVPLWLVEELKTLYLGKGQVEYIDATAVEINAQPPALEDSLAKDLIDQARAIYDEIKRKHGLKKLTAANFNRYLTAAQHDHGRLEDLIAHLVDVRDGDGGD